MQPVATATIPDIAAIPMSTPANNDLFTGEPPDNYYASANGERMHNPRFLLTASVSRALRLTAKSLLCRHLM
ncbi:MAG: hypothetical protein GPOALKHO_000680 [Sodalis sp.]|nr:MAG: hypothetical protein GPOALKHO_000680 [Sodalis sp.]